MKIFQNTSILMLILNLGGCFSSENNLNVSSSDRNSDSTQVSQSNLNESEDTTSQISGLYPCENPEFTGQKCLDIGVKYRDFHPSHSDFELFLGKPDVQMNDPINYCDPSKSIRGMVNLDLDENHKPTKAKQACGNFNFDDWFNTKSGINLEFQELIILRQDKTNPSLYKFTSKSFFPLDSISGTFGKENAAVWCDNNSYPTAEQCKQWTKNKQYPASNASNTPVAGTSVLESDIKAHNFNFTLESHLAFTYYGLRDFNGNPTEKLIFKGSDDAWIFIDGQLVADLGGTHAEQTQTIDFSSFGWLPNTTHTIDFFNAERQTDGSQLSLSLNLNDVVSSGTPSPQIVKILNYPQGDSSDVYLNTSLSTATLKLINNGSLKNAFVGKKAQGDTVSVFTKSISLKPLPATKIGGGTRYVVKWDTLHNFNSINLYSGDSLALNSNQSDLLLSSKGIKMRKAFVFSVIK